MRRDEASYARIRRHYAIAAHYAPPALTTTPAAHVILYLRRRAGAASAEYWLFGLPYHVYYR